MLELDREYVRRRSLALDLRILLATVPAVLTGRGAR
jgi:lipopolysaccharide/colanic/teichoic acid biosynthesis glycosyltransferase